MKWLLVCSLFLLPFFSGAQLPRMSEILNLLPDSAFSYCSKLTSSQTFSVNERRLILNSSDSTAFRIEIYSDSLHEISFGGGDYTSAHIKYWVGSKNEIYIAVIQSKCDFVMCFQKNSFYKLKKGQLTYFNFNYSKAPLKYFFPADKLKECGLDPEKGCIEYTLSIENNHIVIHFQDEYLSKELMGNDGKYVCLENIGLRPKDILTVFYIFNRKKFELKTKSSL